ncbi:MAG: tRNA dihydrouridine synthase DusB [Hahellaceae bacterium]|nr:tRNA dihydrouridine synthase DusB [Hahellaceae bacterium]MCP5169651.1 tRNA dihydrouridine synthase DusB [Hahellaceae bacterium]
MLTIGPYNLENPLILAPMAGVTDLPFRRLCRQLGAGMAVSEMVIANPDLWDTRKSYFRLNHEDEAEPRSVQIAGADPDMLANAARMNEERGAQIIDINMGCPAKKVCNRAAGSALLRDEALVTEILQSVVKAVTVPVTLKIRTGWDSENRNALTIARIAEDAGIQALAIHGRTRACKFEGEAEYETIARVKQRVSIPVFANGDIDSPEKARFVLDHTQADGLLIGRAAQGNPWIFREILHYLKTGEKLPSANTAEVRQTLLMHVKELHRFYGDYLGLRIARKHVGWYMKTLPQGHAFRAGFNSFESAQQQLDSIEAFFENTIH